jgi:HEPN superfamily protein
VNVFPALRSDVEDRLLLIEEQISVLSRVEDEKTVPQTLLKTLKGLTFVQLYAVYEQTVVGAVQAAIRALNMTRIPLRELRHELLGIALDANCRSLADCGPNRTWDVRVALMGKTRSEDPVEAPEEMFPADGTHYRFGQLQTLWTLFGIPSLPVPEMRLIGRIEELVELRNGISHGRLRAEEVGSTVSVTDLRSRHGDIREICRHLIATLEMHVNDPTRLRG